jgi:hypothetical protein
MWKELSSELLDLMVFFNELTIKCIIRFDGFVKISKDSWQLIVEVDHLKFSNIIKNL